MKKTLTAKTHSRASDKVRSEYDFDYRKSRPNRFAGRVDEKRLVVALDPDVCKVFTTPESVNSVLRALIVAMPRVAASKSRRNPPRARVGKRNCA